MREVEDAVILAGGRGTRMLPISLYTAKEVLPLVDTPIIYHLIWEAYEAGVKRIHIVHSPDKENQLKKIINNEYHSGHNSINLSDTIDIIPHELNLILHEQPSPGGVGDALKYAIDHLKGAFILMLGDNLLIKDHHKLEKNNGRNGSFASKKLIQSYKSNGIPCTGIKKVNSKELKKFGVVGLNNEKITKIIEKPDITKAPTNYVLCGRYLLLDDVRDLLNSYSQEEFGELQFIAILNHYINNSGLNGIILDDYDWYDSGDPISWIKSQIDHALKREDLKVEIEQFIRDLSN